MLLFLRWLVMGFIFSIYCFIITTISEIRYQCMLKEVAAFLEKHSATLSLYISLTFTYPTSPSASFISAKSTGLFILLCLFICTFSHNIPYVWNNLSLVSAKFTLYQSYTLSKSVISVTFSIWTGLDVFWELLLIVFIYTFFFILFTQHTCVRHWPFI